MDPTSLPVPAAARLPFELERDIFEIAARNSPTSVPSFLRVARRVHTWLEPELYRVIRSGEGRVVPPALYKTQDCNVPREPELDAARLARFGPWVRHILLQNRPAGEVARVLLACPHAHDVALWIVRGECAPLPPLLAALPLRRLSLDPTALFEMEAAGGAVPLARWGGAGALTHLEVINASTAWAKWRELAALPCLTHLAFAGPLEQAFVDRVLAECKALRVCVLLYVDMYQLEELDMVQKDPRVVVLLKAADDHLAYWEMGARGGEDFWATADRRVRDVQEMVKHGKQRFDVHHMPAVLGHL